MNSDNQKKENQVDNLMNLVERHTRTERHLEQYSEIGSKENKQRAREKQDVREEEMNNLKSKLVNENETKTEQYRISFFNVKTLYGRQLRKHYTRKITKYANKTKQ